MVAVRLVVDGGKISAARIATGACAPVAVRLWELEDVLVGSDVKDAPELAREMLTGISSSLPRQLPMCAPLQSIGTGQQPRSAGA